MACPKGSDNINGPIVLIIEEISNKASEMVMECGI